jgi:hypothetical protein
MLLDRRNIPLIRVNVNDSRSNLPTNTNRVFTFALPDVCISLKNVSYGDSRSALPPQSPSFFSMQYS